jgi:DNA-binding GntR family transcriptional regulator
MAMEMPRYVQIFNTLSKRMESGQYPLEMRLPTESELCNEFEASRFTVREALRRLVDQGMVQRRQGAGSVVVAAKPKARYVHSLASLSDLFQFALNTHYELLSLTQVTLDAKTAADVGGEAGERWWLMKGLRRNEQGGKVFCYLHSYIPPRFGKYVLELARCIGAFYAHLAERSGEEILDVEHDLRGVRMNKDVALHLNCADDTISMCSLRRYISKRGTVIATYNYHVAEDFNYRMKISRNI